MTTTENARRVLDDLVCKLDTEVIARFIEKRLFSRDANIPMQSWSLLNQLVAYCSGTSDARGYRQWLTAGRHVRRGARALYILVPIFATLPSEPEAKEEKAEGEKEPEKHLSGFRAMPVFRAEDTQGEPLAYERALDGFDPSRLPLYEVAVELGVTVAKGLTTTCYGWYSDREKKILLGTDDVTTFLHELAHAVDHHLPGRVESYDFGECVAELSSCFLCHLYGLPAHDSRTKAYIESYRGTGHVAFKIIHIIERVMAIYGFIAEHAASPASDTV